jgi:hypothetical protein
MNNKRKGPEFASFFIEKSCNAGPKQTQILALVEYGNNTAKV